MKLITWNTQWCLGLDGQSSPARIVEHARDMADFDVLCLQEIAVDCPGLPGVGAMDQAAWLRALLPGFEVFFGAACIERSTHGRLQQFGNLIATRLPVQQVQHHSLPWPADPGQPSMPRMCTSVTLQRGERLLRVMTTHLEYYSALQRTAQVQALCDLQRQAARLAATPPMGGDAGTPFQAKPHTASAIVCGDFNMSPTDAAYDQLLAATDDQQQPLWQDAWRVRHGQAPHPPTFRLYDHTHGPEPVCCDFVWVTSDLAPHVLDVQVSTHTQASDHQPVLVVFDF